MKLKGSYRYFAKISSAELSIIQNALELLLESYEYEPYLELDYRKGLQKQEDVEKMLKEVKNETDPMF